VDIGRAHIKEAMRRALVMKQFDVMPYKKSFKCMDIMDAEAMELNGFDYVLASHVMEHVTDAKQLIKVLVHALKPGGRFLIIVPYGTAKGLKSVERFVDKPGAQVLQNEFTESTLKAIIPAELIIENDGVFGSELRWLSIISGRKMNIPHIIGQKILSFSIPSDVSEQYPPSMCWVEGYKKC